MRVIELTDFYDGVTKEYVVVDKISNWHRHSIEDVMITFKKVTYHERPLFGLGRGAPIEKTRTVRNVETVIKRGSCVWVGRKRTYVKELPAEILEKLKNEVIELGDKK